MELTMSPEHVGPMRRAYFPRMLVQSPRGCCPPSTFSQCPRVCSSNTRGTSEGCCRIRGAYSEGRFQERKKLTMVKAQAYLKAGKTKKSAMLEHETCESVRNPFVLFRNILWHISWHVNHSLDLFCCTRSKEGKKRARIRDAIQRTSPWDLPSTTPVLAKMARFPLLRTS